MADLEKRLYIKQEMFLVHNWGIKRRQVMPLW